MSSCIGTIKGQQKTKKALLLAAAGNHNLLLVGVPGEGKTTLAKSIISFLPELTNDQRAALDSLYVGGYKDTRPPFCEVHHTTTIASLIGGYNSASKSIVPGLVSRACYGVLFLDELTEFGSDQLEALRTAITESAITISRTQGSKVFPTCFQLVAACNPCRCGYHGTQFCKCSASQVARYQRKISGPILDRIDLFADIYPITSQERLAENIENQSKLFYSKVLKSRHNQYSRQGFGICNGQLSGKDIFAQCKVEHTARRWLAVYMDKRTKIPFSTRRMISLVKISRTLADLYNSETVTVDHLQHCLPFTRSRSLVI